MNNNKSTKSFVYRLVFCAFLLCQQAQAGEPRYKCPNNGTRNTSGFVSGHRWIKVANSCYYLSGEIASWQEAHFRCRDMNAQLAVLATEYEDNSLRNYLERRELAQLGRWIGGMWTQGKWIWAAQGNEIDNQRAFVSASVQHSQPSDQWMCLYMDSRNRYRWSSSNCLLQYHYVCETPLTRTRTTTTTVPPYYHDNADHEPYNYNVIV